MGLIFGLLIGIGLVLIWSAIKEPVRIHVKVAQRIRRVLARRKIIDAQLWPDVVDDLASAVRAGLSLPQAVAELCVSGPAVLRPAFEMCRAKYQATGDFSTGLALIARELQDPHADKFVTSLQVAYEVGGADLGVLLRTLSEVMREGLVTRGEILTRQGWTVSAARLAIAAPWATALVLSTRAATASTYTSPGGLRMLATCAAISIGAYFTMMSIARLPQEDRLLA
jgi:tight adherence protein B